MDCILSININKKNFPADPGVYQMLNQHGQILYVGKANHLKRRLSSYFRSQGLDPKTAAMMKQVVDIKISITNNAVDALLLEANLIKTHRPKYNILLRDDKSYPYLLLTVEDEFPRLDFYRGAKRKKGRYFGPYPSAGAVRENLAWIQKLFKLRQCSDHFFKNRTRPCLQYQIKRCTAPCVDYVTREDYAEQVEQALLFLAGKNKLIMDDLVYKMEESSQALEYEQAAAYRDKIALLRQLQEKEGLTGEAGNIDILGVAKQMGQIVIVVLFIRNGRLIGDKSFFPKVSLDEQDQEALAAFIPQYYLDSLHSDEPIHRIVSSRRLPDKTCLEQALQNRLKRKIIITDRKQAAYQQWQMMADTNAESINNFV